MRGDGLRSRPQPVTGLGTFALASRRAAALGQALAAARYLHGTAVPVVFVRLRRLNEYLDCRQQACLSKRTGVRVLKNGWYSGSLGQHACRVPRRGLGLRSGMG